MFHFVTIILVTQFIISNGLPLNQDVSSKISPKFLTQDDFLNAETLTNKQIDKGVGKIKEKSMFHKGFYGGDIVDAPKKKNKDVHGYISKSSGRHWPKGRVPYVFVDDFTLQERAHIAKAIDFFHNKTCIRFVPKTEEDKNFVRLIKDDGCYSEELGRFRKAPQEVSLGENCFRVDIIIHEFMHVLGFMHEFSRPDRDEYIEVNYDNMKEDEQVKNQFKKISGEFFGDWKLPFDVKSAMFYEADLAAKAPFLQVMKAKNGQELRCRPHLCPTLLDAQKINMIYGCKDYILENKIKEGENAAITIPTTTTTTTTATQVLTTESRTESEEEEEEEEETGEMGEFTTKSAVNPCTSLKWKSKLELNMNDNLVMYEEGSENDYPTYICSTNTSSEVMKVGETNKRNSICHSFSTSVNEWNSRDYLILTNPQKAHLEWKSDYLEENDSLMNGSEIDEKVFEEMLLEGIQVMMQDTMGNEMKVEKCLDANLGMFSFCKKTIHLTCLN